MLRCFAPIVLSDAAKTICVFISIAIGCEGYMYGRNCEGSHPRASDGRSTNPFYIYDWVAVFFGILGGKKFFSEVLSKNYS